MAKQQPTERPHWLETMTWVTVLLIQWAELADLVHKLV
jgi:hypothetical protein